MGFYDTKKGVEEYVEMAKGYDGKELIEVLKKYLAKGSTVLELGMGPGVDLEILGKDYKATGSDFSQVFLDRYKEKHPNADVLISDAVTLETDRRFDCIYSNKVLHHLTKEELGKSFQRQSGLLNKGGLAFHSFWYGDKEENMHGLLFVYYTEDTLKEFIGDKFEIVSMNRYEEMSENDSLYVLLKKK